MARPSRAAAIGTIESEFIVRGQACIPGAWALAAVLSLAGIMAARADQAPGPAAGDLGHPFFASLGTNGRACASCHHPDDSWTVTPARLLARFEASEGLDPVFRPGDGANCDSADVTTVADRRRAYSLLLDKGLIRVARPVPADAEFEVLAVDNPYGCSSRERLSVYRRPPPLMNFDLLSMVMWDGRHTVGGRAIEEDLAAQAVEATLVHGETDRVPADTQVRALVAFQRSLSPRRAPSPAAGPDPGLAAAIRRGEATFMFRFFSITGVRGLNDVSTRGFEVGSCFRCHDVKANGRRVPTALLDIGVNDPVRRTPDVPLFTLRCLATGEVVRTLDPGRALVTGACRDIGKVKEPILRGLAARAPYFHNGSAATLMDVVEFYNARFRIGLGPQEKADLVSFLRTL
jgi:cytochrome c peroxidase